MSLLLIYWTELLTLEFIEGKSMDGYYQILAELAYSIQHMVAVVSDWVWNCDKMVPRLFVWIDRR